MAAALNVANVVAREVPGARNARLLRFRGLFDPGLQYLCGVAAPRSVGSTPAPLRQLAVDRW